MPEYHPTTATNEEQLQLLLECFHDFEILTLDAGGFVVSWTANGEYAQDHHTEDIIGKHHSIFYSPEDISCNKPEQELEIAKTTGRCKVRGWRFRRDGTSCWADVVTTALWNPGGSLRGFARIIRNITENRAEEALRASEERYRLLFEKNLAAVSLTTPEGQVLNFNEAMVRVLGYQSFEETVGVRPSDVYVEPGDRDDMIRQLRQRGMLSNYELRLKRKDGETVWALANTILIRGNAAAPELIQTTLIDVTEPKRVEEELHRMEAHYRELVSWVPAIIWRADAKTFKPTFIGGRVEQLLGYRPPDWLNEPNFWRRRLHPDDRDSVISACHEATRKGLDHECEYRMLSADGRMVWFRDYVHVVAERGEPKELIGVMVDITARKQAEAQVRASQERFHNAFAHTVVGMCLIDLSGQYLEVNQAYCKITGYSVEELARTDFGSFTHPEDRPKNERLMKQMLAGKLPNFVVEKRYLRKSGDIVWVRKSCTLLGDSQGKPAQIIALVEDITERKQAEETLHQLSGHLMRLQDEERRKLARELHDRTAQDLVALGMNLDIIRESEDRLEGRGRRALAESTSIADRCIREMRTLSYLLHPPFLEQRGLRSAVKMFVDGFQQRSGIRVDLHISEEMGRLPEAIEVTMFRVVQESLTNIRRHSGSSTASIHIRRGPDLVKMQIKDRGHGMPKAPSSDDPMGVGIASMRERVRQVGGQMELLSNARGTLLKVTIPVKIDNESADRPS